MITKYLEVHKRKHIVKLPEFRDEVRNISAFYYVKFEFNVEEDMKLPETGGQGLKFVLNKALTKKEQAAVGLVKTLDDGRFEAMISAADVEKSKANAPVLSALNSMDMGLKVIRMFEDELDGKCSKRLQEYIDTKKELRKQLQ